MDKAQLSEDVKKLIIDAVNLQHLKPETFASSASLFQEGIGLDSVDILEIVVAIESKYDVKVPDAESGKQTFQSVDSIVDFIVSQKSETTN